MGHEQKEEEHFWKTADDKIEKSKTWTLLYETSQGLKFILKGIWNSWVSLYKEVKWLNYYAKDNTLSEIWLMGWHSRRLKDGEKFKEKWRKFVSNKK